MASSHKPKSAMLTAALAFDMTGLAPPAQMKPTSQSNISQSQSTQSQSTQSQSTRSQSTQSLNMQSTTTQSMPYSQTEAKSAQQKLKDDGYYNGKVDGIDGPMTHAAVRKYQQSQNLTVNGRLDRETCNSLGVRK